MEPLDPLGPALQHPGPPPSLRTSRPIGAPLKAFGFHIMINYHVEDEHDWRHFLCCER
jgi:hypothetical protein